MSAVEAGHSIGKQRAKLAALLAYLAANGHPSIAPTWHPRIWNGVAKRGNRRNRSRFRYNR